MPLHRQRDQMTVIFELIHVQCPCPCPYKNLLSTSMKVHRIQNFWSQIFKIESSLDSNFWLSMSISKFAAHVPECSNLYKTLLTYVPLYRLRHISVRISLFADWPQKNYQNITKMPLYSCGCACSRNTI